MDDDETVRDIGSLLEEAQKECLHLNQENPPLE